MIASHEPIAMVRIFAQRIFYRSNFKLGHYLKELPLDDAIDT
jgi:hypothetical protein